MTRDDFDLECRSGAQSKVFMIDLMPYIQKVLSRYPWKSMFNVLDVGCGTGHGANLLASIYNHSGFLGARMTVDVLDIDVRYKKYIEANCHFINNIIIGDIFELNLSYDIVICSHVIEHVNQPQQFVERLKNITKKHLFVIAPFKERSDIKAVGHINIFDDEFLDSLKSLDGKISKIHSAAWGGFFKSTL